jgi:hypothetical protein
MKDSWPSMVWSGALVLILAVLLIGAVTMLSQRTDSIGTSSGSVVLAQLQQPAQALAAQTTTATVNGAYRGDVDLAWVVCGVCSDTLAAPTPQAEGTLAATELGSITLVLQLNQSGDAVSGHVDLTQALTFDVVHTLNDGTKTGPTVSGTLNNSNVVLTSERFTTQVANKSYTRQFQLTGAVDANADFISGTYRETLWGYSETPYTISGNFTLQRVTVEGYSGNSGNIPPTTAVDTASIAQGQAVSINVLANDSDGNNDTLTVTGVSQPQFGTATVSGNGQSVTYTPNADFVGDDQFTYFVSDGRGGTAAGTVRITVNGSNGQNRAPTATSDTATTNQATAVTINVLANDSDPDGDTLTVTGVSQPQFGTATVSGNGQSVTYTPNADFVGDDQFTYVVSDGKGGTATGTVHVRVNDPNTSTEVPTIYLPLIQR